MYQMEHILTRFTKKLTKFQLKLQFKIQQYIIKVCGVVILVIIHVLLL